MQAGKSTVLLQAAHNYLERGLVCYLLTAKLDTRSGVGRIGSRIGLEKEADTFEAKDDLFVRLAERAAAEQRLAALKHSAHVHSPSSACDVPCRYGLQ